MEERILKRVCAVMQARRVTKIERVQRLWQGYGEIPRLSFEGASVPTVIVKLVQPGAARPLRPSEQRSHARKLRSYDVETSFYTHYASRCSEYCRVARNLTCEKIDDRWLFILEDLDAAGFAERRDQLSPHAARVCLSWLANFHATFMHEPPQELWPTGTYWHLHTRPDELTRCEDPQLKAAAHILDERLRNAHYRSLVHGDAKVENFCFTPKLDKVTAVDFQYTGAGIGVQDVAYFLGSCLDDQTCETHAADLLDHYFHELHHALANKTIDKIAVQKEWRALYPTAWADFARFMSGWTRGYNTRSGYTGDMVQLALAGST